MPISRTQNFVTDEIRRIIRRDTLIITHVALTIIIILDIAKETEETWPFQWKMVTLGLAIVNILFGVARLRDKSTISKNPLIAGFIITGVLCFAFMFAADFGSAYIYMLLVPIFLASYFAGNREIYAIYIVSGLALVVAPITQSLMFGADSLTPRGVPVLSFYNLSLNLMGFVAMVSISRLIIDTTQVSNEDKRAMHQAATKIKAQNRQIENIVSSINEAIIGLDPDGKINFVNASAQGILNSHASPLGKKLGDLLMLEDRSGAPVDTVELLTPNLQHQAEHILVIRYNPDDAIIVSIIVKAVNLDATTHSGFVVVLRDVTEQTSREEDRHAYISLLSHELRTPLAYLEGQLSNLQLLTKKADNESIAQSVDDVHDQTLNLTSIVNQLTQYIQADAEGGSQPKQEIDVSEIASSLLDSYREQAKVKGIDLKLDIDSGAHCNVPANAMYVRSILITLIDNAVKFTDEGFVRIHIYSTDKDVCVDVVDTGAGISKHHQLTVFESGKQAEDYETRTKGGLGLSLYTASRLAKQLGASLSVDSEVGRGSTFRVVLSRE